MVFAKTLFSGKYIGSFLSYECFETLFLFTEERSRHLNSHVATSFRLTCFSGTIIIEQLHVLLLQNISFHVISCVFLLSFCLYKGVTITVSSQLKFSKLFLSIIYLQIFFTKVLLLQDLIIVFNISLMTIIVITTRACNVNKMI